MSFNHTLIEPFSLDGLWGLPGTELSTWVAGRLEFHPENGIRLALYGLLGEKLSTVPGEGDLEIIHGVTQGAEKVTLLRCKPGGGGFAFSADVGAVRSQYAALWMVVGEYLNSLENLTYKRLSINFHNLEEFAGWRPFHHEVEKSEIKLSFRPPEPLSMELDGLQVELALSGNVTGDYFIHQELSARAWLILTTDPEIHTEQALKGIFASLHYLIELAVGRRLPIVSLLGESVRTEKTIEGMTLQEDVHLFFAQKRPLPVPPREHAARLLFTLSALGSSLAEHLSRWHAGFSSFRDAMDFYFSLDPESDTDVALEHHFLSILNAFESYHRLAGKKQFDFSEANHGERLKQILETAPIAHREWLGQQLEHSNEVRLRGRLKEVYDDQPDNVKALLGKKKDFVGPIVDTRNYLTHHSVKLKAQALTGLGLWLAIKKVRLVLQVCFLGQMGLADDVISKVIERSGDYQILRRNSSDGKKHE
jgi:hypothetical protein